MAPAQVLPTAAQIMHPHPDMRPTSFALLSAPGNLADVTTPLNHSQERSKVAIEGLLVHLSCLVCVSTSRNRAHSSVPVGPNSLSSTQGLNAPKVPPPSGQSDRRRPHHTLPQGEVRGPAAAISLFVPHALSNIPQFETPSPVPPRPPRGPRFREG